LKVLVFPLGMGTTTIAVQVMHASAYWNLLLAAFNLLPIPPLDGSRVMSYLLPANLRAAYNSVERFGMLIIIGLLYTGVLGVFLYPLMDQMWNAINALTGGSWTS
jgi:Zn-dependent protease